MAKIVDNRTRLQKLTDVIIGTGTGAATRQNNVATYNINPASNVLYTFDNKEARDQKLLQMKQQKLLAYQWKKINYDSTMNSLAGAATQVKVMYRDADLMDQWPEISAALDIYAEEATTTKKGKILNVYSKSERIKAILEDLFINRLDLNVTLPAIVRSACKYGNDFWYLNIDDENGILGWRPLDVHQMLRIESGLESVYGGPAPSANLYNLKPDEVKFVWEGHNETQPFLNWQVAHFRLIKNTIYLPYGCAILNGARRYWRMLSMMEDALFLYRLERSVERRIFKVNVGAIDETDVQAFLQDFASNIKRAPIIDPQTGQIDLRKNFLPVWKKTPIPLLDGRTITIEQLANEFNNGKVNYVYSVQEGTDKIVPGKVVWCGKNYTANKMIKIILDDDTYMVMAPEHPVVMRDGTKKRADEILIGESVMPFYREINKNAKCFIERYEKVYNPNTGKFEYTHRLIAQENPKGNEKYNTVHHINFNRYDNRPENLLWWDFQEHKKYHSQLIGNCWKDPEVKECMLTSMRKYHATHPMSQERKDNLSKIKKELYKNGFPKETAEKISKILKDKYANDKEFKTLMEKKWEKRDRSYLNTPEFREKMRKIAKDNFKISAKYFNEYNHSELHKQHNEIRSAAMKEFWKNEGSEISKQRMTVKFDNFIWEEIRHAILSGIIYNRITMLEYINTHLIEHLLEINTSEKLHNNGYITRGVLQKRIKEIGFNTITEYITSIKRNHKVKSIEYVNGDDVYCMTVVGLNGEEDRHNFALQTFNEDGSYNFNGVFVGNSVDQDFIIPVRPGQEGVSSIDTLNSAQLDHGMEDIEYMQNKILSVLKVPKTFLNFQEAQGKGQNLALMDVRFSRTINWIQQTILMELTKIAIIHLYLLGFEDDLTNFSLTMNNPSNQIEMMELDNMTKRMALAANALAEQGGGIPLMSWHDVQKEILGKTDAEISNILNEIRLESAIATELQLTNQIIKKTGLFDKVDRLYGEPGAKYNFNALEGGDMGGPGGGLGGGGGMGPMDSGFGDDMGDIGGEDIGADMGGEEGATDLGGDLGGNEGGGGNLMEIRKVKKNQLLEDIFTRYNKEVLTEKEKHIERPEIINKGLMINEELMSKLEALEKIHKDSDENEE